MEKLTKEQEQLCEQNDRIHGCELGVTKECLGCITDRFYQIKESPLKRDIKKLFQVLTNQGG